MDASTTYSDFTYAVLIFGTLGLLIFAFVVPILVGYARQPEDARIDGLGRFAGKYLRARSGSLIIAVLAWLVGGLVWGIVTYLAVRALMRFRRGDRDAQRSRWTKACARAEKEWLESLGATVEERIANVNRMFDRKEKTLTNTGWAEWGAAGALLGTAGPRGTAGGPRCLAQRMVFDQSPVEAMPSRCSSRIRAEPVNRLVHATVANLLHEGGALGVDGRAGRCSVSPVARLTAYSSALWRAVAHSR